MPARPSLEASQDRGLLWLLPACYTLPQESHSQPWVLSDASLTSSLGGQNAPKGSVSGFFSLLGPEATEMVSPRRVQICH